MDIDKTIRRYGLVSDQVDAAELTVIIRECERALAADGAIVEFGCYRGTTSLYLRRLLNYHDDARDFHVYDSFEGLPEKSSQDSSPAGEQFRRGELTVSKKDFINEFKRAALQLPNIHKGWFDELSDTDVPNPIAFAFLDGDYYDSIKSSLALIENKLAPHATIVVDDYANEALPGAAKAVDEWLQSRLARVQTVQSLAVIRL